MTVGYKQDAGSVFVNCPFDAGYKGLFDTIVFTVFDRRYRTPINLVTRDRTEADTDKPFVRCPAKTGPSTPAKSDGKPIRLRSRAGLPLDRIRPDTQSTRAVPV
ncbi:MAG: hypothetical protein EA353_07605 [Puniceicoccaceae bacterium]|nr:MAG: hypothetical protein EA353_07605 [Puniceicoccaceae bacterium]